MLSSIIAFRGHTKDRKRYPKRQMTTLNDNNTGSHTRGKQVPQQQYFVEVV